MLGYLSELEYLVLTEIGFARENVGKGCPTFGNSLPQLGIFLEDEIQVRRRGPRTHFCLKTEPKIFVILGTV